MATFKETLQNIKNDMPKHVKWLLMGAAFIIVLILLVLLLTGGKKKADIKTQSDALDNAQLFIGPSEIEWFNVTVGDKKTQKIIITASADTKISSVKFSRDVPGLSMKSTCTNIGTISENIPCAITLEWVPDTEMNTVVTEIQVLYYPAALPESFAITSKIPIALSSKAAAPAPVIVPEPEPEPIVEPEPVLPPEPVKPFVPEIAPTLPLENDIVFSDACYEYAFAGYNNAGVHSGWIRADGGRYMYHPFSDAHCNNPTGEYNPNTGMITAIGNPSQKIGTDAEHIGWGISSSTLTVPTLSNPATINTVNRAQQLVAPEMAEGGAKRVFTALPPTTNMLPSSFGTDATVSSQPYDRTFVLRQYKPIPATIVSEIRATANASKLPVQATVDRNVYSDNGRTIIIPAGTLMIGALSGTDMPGPYKSIGRVEIEWYRFVRPDGVEFNFDGKKPFSADSQGRSGVPGRGSTDYLEQFVMPLLTAIVPAAVNMIAPISDKFINQIDLNNNTVVQSGTVRSSELAKNEVITTWNKIAEKLAIDLMDNQVPPFSVAAGTRITVFSPNDLIVTCGDPNSDDRNCAITAPHNNYASVKEGGQFTIGAMEPDTLLGQVRAYIAATDAGVAPSINDARVAAFVQSMKQYEAKNNATWNEYYKQVSAGNTTANIPAKGTTEYNQQVLGLKTNEAGQYKAPFEKEKKPTEQIPASITCEDGNVPDVNGCCAGEVYTDMGEQGFNCCPVAGGDCFPPIK